MSVYLDHNASAPLRPGVRAAMAAYLDGAGGNPASVHAFGQAATAVVDRARREVAALAGGPAGDVIFTGSGTEAVFTAVTGAVRGTPRGRHAVVSAIEHAAGIEAARALERDGWTVSWAPPEAGAGRVAAETVRGLLRDDTALVSVLLANPETGVVQPVAEIAAGARARGALVHVDAVQGAGRIPLEAEGWGIDLVSLSAHKLGGPMGVGALWKRPGLSLTPLIPGSQERGLRGGTLNVPGIVGFGAAARLAAGARETDGARLHALRERLERGLAEAVPGARVTGAGSRRLPNTVHLTFAQDPGRDLVTALDLEGFAVSAGSACASGAPEPSHVLLAMGFDAATARRAVRVSLGTTNTEAEVDAFVRTLARLTATRPAGTER